MATETGHRVTLGHFDTLMQELMRKSRGDFKSYLRIEPAMFQERVNIVTVTVSPYSLASLRRADLLLLWASDSGTPE